ncbi:MAG TPA: class I tRNA ligase family protein, partial [Candidatus Bathyarchaeia archaeon]|nr:class I tRNA ligase family protein [Candidatus Bathyarchaeia archaeon]
VGVPGHDLRDFQFAKKFALPIIRVVVGLDGDRSSIKKESQVQEKSGTMINSGFLNAMDIRKATKKIMDYIEKKGWGRRTVFYHLRDWLISRQRYWGPPIPMVYCKKCGCQPVAEKDLPVLLPQVKDWRPKGTGRGPLAELKDWIKTSCSRCHGVAERETDIIDNFVDSAWYFLRYPSSRVRPCQGSDPNEIPWDSRLTKKWLPVDMYIGGAEHSVLHLLYSRFLTMAFKDLGLLDFEEPFTKFRAHGLIIKAGVKMSKSKGNIVTPDEYIKKHGADTLRCYLMFIGPLASGGDFRDAGMAGMFRFLARVYRLCQKEFRLAPHLPISQNPKQQISKEELYWQHRTIKRVTEGIRRLKYNVSLAALMEYVNYLQNCQKASQKSLEILVCLLAPFAPHLTEEIWFKIKSRNNAQNPQNRHSETSTTKSFCHSGIDPESVKIKFKNNNSVHNQPWLKYDTKYLKQQKVEVVIQVNGKVRDRLQASINQAQNQVVISSLCQKSAKIQTYIKGKKIKKEIFIKGRLMNLVV